MRATKVVFLRRASLFTFLPDGGMLSLQLINWFVANPILPRPEQLISFIPQPFPAEQMLRGLFYAKSVPEILRNAFCFFVFLLRLGENDLRYIGHAEPVVLVRVKIHGTQVGLTVGVFARADRYSLSVYIHSAR